MLVEKPIMSIKMAKVMRQPELLCFSPPSFYFVAMIKYSVPGIINEIKLPAVAPVYTTITSNS